MKNLIYLFVIINASILLYINLIKLEIFWLLKKLEHLKIWNGWRNFIVQNNQPNRMCAHQGRHCEVAWTLHYVYTNKCLCTPCAYRAFIGFSAPFSNGSTGVKSWSLLVANRDAVPFNFSSVACLANEHCANDEFELGAPVGFGTQRLQLWAAFV